MLLQYGTVSIHRHVPVVRWKLNHCICLLTSCSIFIITVYQILIKAEASILSLKASLHCWCAQSNCTVFLVLWCLSNILHILHILRFLCISQLLRLSSNTNLLSATPVQWTKDICNGSTASTVALSHVLQVREEEKVGGKQGPMREETMPFTDYVY